MAWAFRQDIEKPGAKLVLLALCDHADEAWSCYPGQKLLARKTSQGERTVRRHLEWLEEQGFLTRKPRFKVGRRTSDRYWILKNRDSADDPAAGPDRGSGGDTPPRPAPKHRKRPRAEPTANMAAGQAGHQPEQHDVPAKLAAHEPSGNHQVEDPQPPSSREASTGGCAAHPEKKAASCRACGTNPRAMRAGATRPSSVDRGRQDTAVLLQELRDRGSKARQQWESGALDGQREAAREAARSARTHDI
ncbi:helix-turn-helix domain-containing protein [Streptomyces luteireticuli]|uniref:helix-turn-helix domain-containing protein n=1 Tax=Streptomyces luteireticuli TaxID=173858 RepID=UPI0035587F2C